MRTIQNTKITKATAHIILLLLLLYYYKCTWNDYRILRAHFTQTHHCNIQSING